ncbi:hypothetical protein NKG05_04315 [Oerskovia sp. M15]
MRKTVAAAAGVTLLFGALTACSSERSGEESGGGETGSEDTLIGIAMPTRSLERWNNDGAHLEELLGKRATRPRSSTPTTRSTSRSRSCRT